MHDAMPPPSLLDDLLARLHAARLASAEDPFGDPVLLLALAISRRLDDGSLNMDGLEGLVQDLSDDAAAGRAKRLAAYLGHVPGTSPAAALEAVAARLVRPDPLDSPVPFATFKSSVERTRFAAVFTAHPTFSLPAATARSWPRPPPRASRRRAASRTARPPPTLAGGIHVRPNAAIRAAATRWTGSPRRCSPRPGPSGPTAGTRSRRVRSC
jgi:hypothetical protein